MKNKILLTAITSLFVSFGISTAGPIDPKSVPADVDYYLHLNLDRIDEGKIGEWMSEFSDTMLFKADEESCLRFFTDEADNVSGGVTIYGNGESPEDSIVHVSGLTKKAALIAEIEQSRGHKSSSKDGLTIHSWNEKLKGKGISVYGAFLDDGTMIASQSEGSLMSAINFRNNDGKGIGLPANSNSAILIKANLEKLYKSRYKFLPWLYTIARRESIQYYRKRKPESELDRDIVDERLPSDPIEQSDAHEALWETIREVLTETSSTAFYLRHEEELSIAEIASVLKLTQTHVKVLLHRARKKMANHLRSDSGLNYREALNTPSHV